MEKLGAGLSDKGSLVENGLERHANAVGDLDEKENERLGAILRDTCGRNGRGWLYL